MTLFITCILLTWKTVFHDIFNKQADLNMSFIRTNLLSAEILYFDWFWRLVKINENIVKNELHPHFWSVFYFTCIFACIHRWQKYRKRKLNINEMVTISIWKHLFYKEHWDRFSFDFNTWLRKISSKSLHILYPTSTVWVN